MYELILLRTSDPVACGSITIVFLCAKSTSKTLNQAHMPGHIYSRTNKTV